MLDLNITNRDVNSDDILFWHGCQVFKMSDKEEGASEVKLKPCDFIELSDNASKTPYCAKVKSQSVSGAVLISLTVL